MTASDSEGPWAYGGEFDFNNPGSPLSPGAVIIVPPGPRGQQWDGHHWRDSDHDSSYSPADQDPARLRLGHGQETEHCPLSTS